MRHATKNYNSFTLSAMSIAGAGVLYMYSVFYVMDAPSLYFHMRTPAFFFGIITFANTIEGM